MATAERNKRREWTLFLVSFVIFMVLLVFANEFFWLALPFMLTYFVQALDMM